MKNQLITTQQLNYYVKKLLLESTTMANSNGKKFEEALWNKIIIDFKNICEFVEKIEWKRDFEQQRDLTLQYNFDYSKTVCKYNTFWVKEPNGSQKWPDLLLVNNNIGLPIEIKSCQKDIIIWNSGIPQINGIYLFNCSNNKINKVTFFMGQHIINNDERDYLLISGDMARKAGKSILSPNILNCEFYMRSMHNIKTKFFKDLDISRTRESETLKYIENLTWDIQQTTNFYDKNFIE